MDWYDGGVGKSKLGQSSSVAVTALIAGRTVNSSRVFTEGKPDMHAAKCFAQVPLSTIYEPGLGEWFV